MATIIFQGFIVIVRCYQHRSLKLSWDDINIWAGGKIASRGRTYQRQGHVSGLAVADDGALVAWVEGTERYATRVTIGAEGQLESECTCPYALDCKHGVAVVLEYLQLMERNNPIPGAKPDDERIEDWKIRKTMVGMAMLGMAMLGMTMLGMTTWLKMRSASRTP